LRLLPARLRKIALTLARGESTSEAAEKFGVTASRISQLRVWLKESWDGFQTEAEQVQAAA
jgi:transposase-like protein